jgi:hypothetical protein
MCHCNRAAVSRNRYGVEKTVDTHKILINAIKFMFVFKKYDRQNHVWSPMLLKKYSDFGGGIKKLNGRSLTRYKLMNYTQKTSSWSYYCPFGWSFSFKRMIRQFLFIDKQKQKLSIHELVVDFWLTSVTKLDDHNRFMQHKC